MNKIYTSFAWKKAMVICIVLIISFLSSGFISYLIGPGLTTAAPINAYLNGNLPSSSTTNPPQFLSQTGAFSDLSALTPSQGVIPYDMIEPFWSDGAAKSRWMAIPNDGTHNTSAERIVFSENDTWVFPIGAVLIKHFELGGRRLETRFEVRASNGDYYYLSYKWNSTGTDAELLTTGLDETVIVNGQPQLWHYPSPSECLDCHKSTVGNVLGVKTRQLNRDINYPLTGVNANQLVTLSHLGIITESITDGNAGTFDKLAAHNDLTYSLEERASAYIDVNCSYCHQPATNIGQFDVRSTTPLALQNIIDGPVLYDLGIADARVVVPQDVSSSIMHHRMNSLVSGTAMPPLGKNVVDEEGVQLIADWINSMTIDMSNVAPVALANADVVVGAAPLAVNFDGTASFDNDSDNLVYAWNFDDGSFGSGINTNHTYTIPGVYTATLTVNDGQNSDQYDIQITVLNSNTNTSGVGFADNTSLLPAANYSGVSMSVVDMNGDGKDDIVRYNNAKSLNVVYQQGANQNFTYLNFGDVSNVRQWSNTIADVDQDGYNDILTGGYYDDIKLIYNNNALSYTSTTIPNSNIFIQGSNFVDIDNDGWVDVFACHDDAENPKFKNNGDGTFTNTPSLLNTTTTPTSDNSGNYASIWTDYDNDGDIDLYISKCRGGANSSTDPRRINMLFQNDGNNNYTEVAEAANLKNGAQTWLTDFADIDNDGDLDCIIINHYDNSNLMLNNGDGTFSDITIGSGLLPALNGNERGIQGIFRDFNNDGFVDLLVSGTAHYLFYNNGDGTFTETPNPFNSNDIESFALGDLNQDGFIDVYAGYAQIFNTPTTIQDRLFLNNGNTNHFLNVNLQGVQSNINGIGARVELYGAWGIQIREVRSGEGYGIMNSFSQHFGIGASTAISKVVVKWPSGIIQEINNPAIDQFLTIVEESCTACTASINSFPHTENFETASGNICQYLEDDFNWTRQSGGTPSNGTGPSGAYQGNYYFYMETSTPNYPSKLARFKGACYDLTNVTTASLDFRYHMNGAAMGSLTLEVSTDNGSTWTNLWQKSGNQGVNWRNEVIDLSSYVGSTITYRFSGTSGADYTSDFALDQIILSAVSDPDNDGDGFSASEDCNDNDANLTIVGASCDDGNTATTNDMVQSNCTCAGVDPDNDGDGFSASEDCNDNDANLTIVGASCDDGNTATTNDMVQSNCTCAGVDPDNDGDGFSASEDCNDNDANLTIVGASCDDGNTATTNDMVQSNCTCAGGDPDNDGDGFSASEDCNDNDANLTIVGASCDDGNTATTNDMVQSNCTCAGGDPDNDGDGFSASEDCNDNDANLTIVGASCDDGNAATTNDMVQSNCTCAGTPTTTGETTVSCDENTTITYGEGFITMAGQSDQEYYFQILDINWDGVYNCGWQCGYTKTVSGLPAGDYRVYIKNSDYDVICERIITLLIGGIDPDNDGDGFPASEDCNDNDANLTITGASCDDGNADTTNDIVQSNCTCQGTTTTTGGTTVSCDGNTTITYGDGSITMAGQSNDEYFFQVFDVNWNEVYNCGWQCGYTKTVSGLPAGDYRVFIKDSDYVVICEKVIALTIGGVDSDDDGDGFPASEDCDDTDANLTIVGASCDDGNTATANDVVTVNCTCEGSITNTDLDGDGDGFPASEDCDDTDANLTIVGASCDDGNTTTANDVVTVNCTCEGSVTNTDPDDDGDGFPASEDCDDTDANLTIVGASCDDGNTTTTNDVVTVNCTCEGSVTNTDPDDDGDGFPASEDCDDTDANLTIVGASCDDGNADTTNDLVLANCTCAGTTTTSGGTTVSCDGNTTITYGEGVITMSGPSGQEYYFQIFNASWNELYNCGWQCDNPTTVTSLPAGDYRIFIKDSDYQVICEKVITLTIGGVDPDDDEDGFPASQDCDDNNVNLTIVGASCDDGNADTIDDLVQADCTCSGTIMTTGGTTVSCEENTTITYGDGFITMSGPSGEEYYFQIFDMGWNEVYNCGWQCGNPKTVTDLVAGDYRVFIKNSGYQVICEKVITLTSGVAPTFLIFEQSQEGAINVESADENKKFTLYPNPAFNEFNVSFDTRILEQYTVVVTDIVGTEHFRSTITPVNNRTKLTIKCDSWSAGVYFVRLVNNKQRMKIKRVIVATE